MNLYDAYAQWAKRPADERFASLPAMLDTCRYYYEQACESSVPFNTLRAMGNDQSGEVTLMGNTGLEARLTHWAFGKMASFANAPATYLRKLPPTLAATCLNYGLQQCNVSAPVELLFHHTPPEHNQLSLPNIPSASDKLLILRALTSEKYTRIWNWEVIEHLMPLLEQGWRVPPARPAFDDQPGARRATDEDILDAQGFLSIKVGDWIAPAGLYASAHDMFIFLINEQNRIRDGKTGAGLSRGVFFENSEVGDKALRCTTFLYRHVCGNHIVWDASNVIKLSIRHIGKARKKFADIVFDLKQYANAAASCDEATIRRTQARCLAKTKDEVLDLLFKRFHYSISLEQLDEAFDLAQAHDAIDGDPHTAWGMAQGITRLSQQTPHADVRDRLDRTAGKVLKIAF